MTSTKTATPLGVEPLDLDLVDPHPKNPRRDLGDLAELTASIKTDGVRNPIHVAVSADGERYVVLAGHRRRQASIDAGRTTIPAIIREDVKTDAAALVEMAVENLLRADLTPVEEAVLFEQLQLAGIKPVTIAKRTGRKRATVDARLALLDLPETTREKVHGRQVSIDEAAAMLEFAADPKALEELEEEAGGGDFAYTIERLRRDRERAAVREATRVRLTAAGVRVVDDAEWAQLRLGWSHALPQVLRDVVDLGAGVEDREDIEEALAAAHTGCPHHLAWIQHGGEARYYCADPAVHREAASTAAGGAGQGMSDEEAAREAAERDAERERARADQEACETAAAVRRTFIVDTIAGRRGVLSQASREAIALMVAEQHTATDAYCELEIGRLAPYLGVAAPEGAPGASWQERQAAEDRLAHRARAEMSRRGAHNGLLAIAAATAESTMEKPFAWAYDSEYLRQGSLGRGWLALLDALGYEASSWETGRVEGADAWALEQPDDEEEDGGVEDVVQDL